MDDVYGLNGYAYIVYIRETHVGNPRDWNNRGRVNNLYYASDKITGNSRGMFRLNYSHVEISEINDPVNPEYLSRFDVSNPTHIEIFTDTLLVTSYSKFVELYDVSELVEPVLIHHYVTTNNAYTACLAGEILVVGCGPHPYLESGCLNIIGINDVLDVEKDVAEIVPHEFILYPTYPTPFNSSTPIKYNHSNAVVCVIGNLQYTWAAYEFDVQRQSNCRISHCYTDRYQSAYRIVFCEVGSMQASVIQQSCNS